MIDSLVFVVVGSGVPTGVLRRRVVLGVEASSLAAAERAAEDFAVRIVLETSLLLAAGLAAAFFVAAGFAAAGFVAFAAGLAGAFAAAAFFAGAAFVVLALLVELSALAASDRAAGDFAVRIVFAASVLLAGLAAAFALAGAFAAFGAAFAFTGAAFVALGAAAFLAGAFAAAFATAGFGAAALAGAAFGAVLVAARTAIACARGVVVASSLLIVLGSLEAVSSDKKTNGHVCSQFLRAADDAGNARGVRGRPHEDGAVARLCHATLRVGLASVQLLFSLPSCAATDPSESAATHAVPLSRARRSYVKQKRQLLLV